MKNEICIIKQGMSLLPTRRLLRQKQLTIAALALVVGVGGLSRGAHAGTAATNASPEARAPAEETRDTETAEKMPAGNDESPRIEQTANSASERFSRYKGKFQKRIDRGLDLGLVIGVIEGPHRHIECFGSVSAKTKRPPTAETLFEVGSVSKTFTGLLLATLVSDETVRLDDAIGKLLPRAVAKKIGPARDISLREMATHTGGLPRNLVPVRGSGSDAYKLAIRNATAEEVYTALAEIDPTPKRGPGKGFSYSNGGMELLAHTLEHRTGRSYPTLLREQIWSKLGLEQSAVTMPRKSGLDCAQGHSVLDGEFVPADDFVNAFSQASGGVCCSMNDML